jgi:phosphate-selective porin
LQWALPEELVTFGGSYQNGSRSAGGVNNHYDAWGVDALISYKGFLMKSEYVRTNERAGTVNPKHSWYVQPSYAIGKTTLFYRWDVIDTNEDATDFTEQTEHVFGVNYLWAPTIRLRAEYVLNQFKIEKDANGLDRDYDNIQLSITTSF